jgi:hypothetical protein
MSFLCHDICPFPGKTNDVVDKPGDTPGMILRTRTSKEPDINNLNRFTCILLPSKRLEEIKKLVIPPNSPACQGMVALYQYASNPGNRGGVTSGSVCCKHLSVNKDFYASGGTVPRKNQSG